MPPSRARELRKSMTPQEVKLWLRLRALRVIGYHFRRQSPLKPYIVDFECRQTRLIVEVDGHTRLWLQANHLLCSSKKGISTRQIHRTLGCGMKTARQAFKV